jgi:hypothetical protein
VPMESLNLLGFTFALALGVRQDIREEKEEEPCNQKCIQRFPHEIQKDQSDRDGNIDQYGPSFFWHLFAHWKLQSVFFGLDVKELGDCQDAGFLLPGFNGLRRHPLMPFVAGGVMDKSILRPVQHGDS